MAAYFGNQFSQSEPLCGPEPTEAERTFAITGQLLCNATLSPGTLIVENGTITEIIPDTSNLRLPPTRYRAALVAPGLIDLQINGSFGVDVNAHPDTIRFLTARLPSTGVTAFLPTILSSPPEFYPRVLKSFQSAQNIHGAIPIGLHAEGPFLSPRRVGAHSQQVIENARVDALDTLLEHHVLKMVTLAPEIPGNLDYIKMLADKNVVVSLGHTNAGFEQFIQGIDCGAKLVTHLYSAMSPFQHRAPGAVGAALVDNRVAVTLIADGIHCHPAAIRLALKAKGVDRVILITDAISGAGMQPGTYELQGRKILVHDSLSTLADGTLAGSTLTLDQAVRNMIDLVGVSIPDALRMASEIPARILGLSTKGSLQVGYDADIVLFDKKMHVQDTFVGGRKVYGLH